MRAIRRVRGDQERVKSAWLERRALRQYVHVGWMRDGSRCVAGKMRVFKVSKGR